MPASETETKLIQELFLAHRDRVCRRTDRLFGVLLVVQWLVGIGLSLWITPRTWAGLESSTHPHLYASLILGGVVISLPLFLIWRRPGQAMTRHAIAAAQVLYSALLIHLTGGRLETHFHIFVSLTFLAFYRDWRVLLTGTVIVALDHLLRGYFWPQSVYGLAGGADWRWLEHAGWVIFLDFFLIRSCLQGVNEMHEIAARQARVETMHHGVEAQVLERTAELGRSERRYRSLMEASTAIVWNMPAAGEFDTPQPSWSRYTGQDFDQLKGLGWMNAVHPDDRSFTETTWAASQASNSAYEIEHRLRRHDGEYRHMLVRGVPVRSDDGVVQEWVGVHTDIDEERRGQELLRQGKAAAEVASRMKSEFLANMSHEIRTPLNGIIGMTDLALETDLNRSQREYLDLVKTSAESLLVVINDILDFSKIEAGKLDLDPIDFALQDTLGDTMKSLALRAQMKGLEIACRIPPRVPENLVGDPGRLRQIIINLIGNAIKFTEAGEVVLRVDLQESLADEVVLHFAVSDTGIGIAPEQMGKIFAPFEQADGSTTRKYGGTGLGLTISSRLVELMGGRIWIESEVGSGSTFHFTARFKRSTQIIKRAPRLDFHDLEGLKVLVVDDNATNRLILVEMLKNWRMVPTAVDGGLAALAELQAAAAAGRDYPLILLDAMMPVMDGLSVAEQVQAQSALSRSTVMMLSSGGLGDSERCRRSGIDLYLMKPIKQSELLDAISQLLAGSKHPHPKATILATNDFKARFKPLRILLAEDNAVNQKLAVALLGKQGHLVTVAVNGRIALDLHARQSFDLILMDFQMPEMGGFEATQAIRDCEKTRGTHTPIIALTAHAMKGDRERCLEAGMDGYVSKPIRMAELSGEIARLLPDAILAPTEAPPTSEPEPVVIESFPDKQMALRFVDGDESLLGELVGLFLDDCPRLLAELRSAIGGSDAVGIKRAAHTLKGALMNFGADAAVADAQRLETVGKTGDLTDAETLSRALEARLDSLRPVLATWTI